MPCLVASVTFISEIRLIYPATPQVGTPQTGEQELPPDSPPALNVPAIDPAKELASRMFRLRKKVLLRDPGLAALHRAVVIKGKLSETDFWSTRQVRGC